MYEKKEWFLSCQKWWVRKKVIAWACVMFAFGVIVGGIAGFWWCFSVNAKPAITKMEEYRQEMRKGTWIPSREEGKDGRRTPIR